MMSETLTVLLVIVAGFILGLLFFGGLWWTVNRGLSSRRPTLWFMGSFVLRTAIVLAGLYLVAGDDWQRLLLCLFGFIIARAIVRRYTDRQPNQQCLPAKEAGHATDS
ncbi:ATP synthase subunit I [Desulfogranum marinum]|uniref:N-ATPase subunit AtpR n=1 Tax=Desulfogranum marinum TaxID=453220 RepID=UPI001E388C24|nr:ATP synthase subunit I [Desulfogranum marinum]